MRMLHMMFGFMVSFAIMISLTSAASERSDSVCAENGDAATNTRNVILAFEKLAFEERKPKEAMEKYAAADFFDHNPYVRGDRASVIEHLDRLEWSTGGPQRTIRHLVVDGDIAVIHHRLVRKPGDAAIAAVDIFRVENCKLVEHWDVLQPIPAESVNPRPMF